MDIDETIRSNIAEFGWDVVLVDGDEVRPPMAYSVGLFETFGQPEILAFGLEEEQLRAIVNRCGRLMRLGRRLVHDLYTNQVLEREQCGFKAVRDEHRGHFAYARSHYGHDDFPVLQCVWTDDEGRFPWDPECDAETRRAQPLLFA